MKNLIYNRKLHLQFAVPFITISSEKWQGSAFETLKEGYTGQDVLNALTAEMAKEWDQDYIVTGTGVSTPVKLLYAIGAVENGEGAVQIDQAVFRQVYELEYARRQNRIAVGEKYTGSHRDNLTDYESWNGKYLLSDWLNYQGASQMNLVYAENMNAYGLGQETKVIYYPTLNEGGSYLAEDKLYGMIGEGSAQKEKAYSVLRQLMDMPLNTWTEAYGTLNPYLFCPVNREMPSSFWRISIQGKVNGKYGMG